MRALSSRWRLGGALVALPLTLSVMLSACGWGQQSAGGDEGVLRVAIIRWDPNDIYFNGVQAGEEQEIQRLEKEHGVKIETTVFGANDAAKQEQALRAQLARGVDGVSLVPWRGQAMTGVLKELQDKGIPVVVHNAAVPKAAQTFVAFDNVKAGRLAGEAITRRLSANRGTDWAAKGGVVILLRCIITASFDIDRTTGYRQVFDPLTKTNSALRVEIREAGCDGEKARVAVDDIVSRHGQDKVLAVASVDGTMAVGGAIPALKSRGMLHPKTVPDYVPVTSVDCSNPELQSIGRSELTHCSEQPALGEGIVAQRLLFDMMQNKTKVPGMTPDQLQTELHGAYGKQPWMPLTSRDPVGFTGQWFSTRAFAVPGEVALNAPGHWATAAGGGK